MLQLGTDPASDLLRLSGPYASQRVVVATSIRHIGKLVWNACFQDEIEDYDYLVAVETSGMEGFTWRYLALFEDGRAVAAIPLFLTEYQLETTMDSQRLRGIVQRIRRHLPSFLALKLACLGSPCTETCVPGFHPDVPSARKPELLAALLVGFERFAGMQGCSLRGVKDFPNTLGEELRRVLDDKGFAAIPGMPTAWLDVDFSSIDDYLGRLSAGTRKDMRRKLKSSQYIRIEARTDLTDLLPRVLCLYQGTRNRSDWKFEALTAGYFAGVLENMPGRSLCFCYYVGETLLAANLLVRRDGALIDKFFCMDAQGRRYNLYYLSWFNNLSYCIEQGIKRYQSGQSSYDSKLRLGSKLTANTMFFKHRNPVVQRLLRLVAPLMSIDEVPGQLS
ncbi:GNAT family N-acetyltransferase [Mesorhizobium sp. IMUNJ 23033]|uniref:GNAT family N-acetyltransferase n=1 Tax=Mesorhizobium sp. IMUNJ 23033 TaxID=3378039 RepID=UPI00384D7141